MDINEIYTVKIESINAAEVPALIQSQLTLLGEIRVRIDKAVKSAYGVKKTVVNQVGGKSKGTKESLEDLNKAAITIASSQIEAMTAQQISFEYQQKLADITRFLFCLGLTNISMNRVVVKELELKLREASEEELDDLARSEIEGLLKRLKAQQDIDKKLSDLSDRVKEQQERLNAQEQQIKELQNKIDLMLNK
ncbi:MAG: hypothetical protein IKP71_07615 [Candidatus Riflebacteria bacterium]|nr:hypothetical protein [Candidatus Riflebacteria bacterium]